MTGSVSFAGSIVTFGIRPTGPPPGRGGLVDLSGLILAVLPPALVAVTWHWKAAAVDTSGVVKTRSFEVDAVVDRRSGAGTALRYH